MPLHRVLEMPRRRLQRRKLDVVPLADRARDTQQWELAAQLYREALDRDPRNPPIWVQYGHALKESGELQDPDKLAQAEVAYRRALSLDPGLADPHLQLGHVLKIQGRTEEARGAYLRAFALDSSLDSASFELAQLGWSEAHLSELRGMLGTDITDPPAVTGLDDQLPEYSATPAASGTFGSTKPRRLYVKRILPIPRLRPKRTESSWIRLADRAPDASQREAAVQIPTALQKSSTGENARLISHTKAVDALHALVLGHLPDNNSVGQENFGRPLIDVANSLIASREFREQVLDAYCRNGKLPHENLSPEDGCRVLAVAREAGLQAVDPQTRPFVWEAVLFAVLGSGSGYKMLHGHHGPAAGHFITMLQRALNPTGLPDDFDPFLYLKANPDVAAAGFDPVEHFVGVGHAENRALRPSFRPLPDDFDPEHFLDTRPSKQLGPLLRLRDGTLPWPTHTFHYRQCDHDKLYRNRAIISYLYLKGTGIEIKALNAPFPKRRDAKVLYLDSATGEELRKRFPHLSGLAVVKPDILDDEVTLPKISDASKDFVILSGALPYFENPILAIENASRVLKPGGTICITVPDKRYGIDAGRRVTDLDHFWQDYREGPEVSRRHHYEDFVATVLNGSPLDAAMHPERLIYSEYPIHFHVWTHHSFILFIQDVIERLPLDCEIELLCRNEIETVCVLRNVRR